MVNYKTHKVQSRLVRFPALVINQFYDSANSDSANECFGHCWYIKLISSTAIPYLELIPM